MKILRSLPLLAVLAASATADAAQVTYAFSGTTYTGLPQSFSFTTNTYIVADTSVGAFAQSSNADSALFDLTGDVNVPPPDVRVTVNGSTFYYYFSPGDFSTNGAHRTRFTGNDATLTVSSQPVPEPATMVALGLGALGVLRRRKRS